MRYIELSQGYSTIVDDDDYEYLRQFNWSYDGRYALRTVYNDKTKKLETLRMHRLVINTPKGTDTDHINRDKLDNRKVNLRICSHSENLRNKPKYKNNRVGFKGVSIKKNRYKNKVYESIIARIRIDNKQIYLGCFQSIELAAKAYNQAAIKYHGQYALLNVV